MSVHYVRSLSPSKREGRISSRLTPFEKLPRIGSSHEYIPRPSQSLQSSHSKSNPRLKQISKPVEPILIAIRLHDGRRLEKEFNTNNKILDIIQYVKSEENDLDDEFYLSSGDVPKRQFKDFNLTLLQANIKTRTILFIDR
ncbi:unnamed protein product [Rotaria magnacalcarata]|uniref:UBX domain-containing protein n=1 Tax=Rotaria magnacalcarata TaxID=392030 RepID=A0A816RL77_9BILA|nr:unnamed protein product [Rotaria magnacalcarata]CAF1568099.1 unnamed protein product [Rotaria magnacalcarata]CAF2058152.1 unnamed protein product [Rotaria magnacalcarata]CAF2074158.1 unnamed protein product [Rotaria magnacalcarata]CAF2243161.1 unnamed protein product [Rotaria magnacalcarata]